LRKRILLDECLPRDLKKSLAGHDATTVPEAGWASKDNGELLALASNDYDVFVTVDRNLTFQQNIANLKIAVIVRLHAEIASSIYNHWFLRFSTPWSQLNAGKL